MVKTVAFSIHGTPGNTVPRFSIAKHRFTIAYRLFPNA